MCVRVLWHCVPILEVHSSLLAVLATTACLTANAETSTGIFNLYRQIFSTPSYFMRNRIVRFSSKNRKIRAISQMKKKIFDSFLELGRFMLA